MNGNEDRMDFAVTRPVRLDDPAPRLAPAPQTREGRDWELKQVKRGHGRQIMIASVICMSTLIVAGVGFFVWKVFQSYLG